MKVKSDFVMRQVAGTWAVLPLGKDVLNFDGMLTLNESGVLLWKKLEQGADREDLVDALLAEYEVSRELAQTDVDEFIAKLQKSGCIE